MKTLSMNLNSAFTLRKRVNEIYIRFANNNRFRNFIVTPDEKLVASNTFETGSFDGDFELYMKAHQASAQITAVIEATNAQGKALLSKISHTNTILEDLKRWKEASTGQMTRKERNPVTGVIEVTELVDLSNISFMAEIKRLEHLKRELEDQLSEFNGQTTVQIDLDEKLFEAIYG